MLLCHEFLLYESVAELVFRGRDRVLFWIVHTLQEYAVNPNLEIQFDP